MLSFTQTMDVATRKSDRDSGSTCPNSLQIRMKGGEWYLNKLFTVACIRVQVGGDVKMSLDLDEAIKEDQLIEQAEVRTHPLTDD